MTQDALGRIPTGTGSSAIPSLTQPQAAMTPSNKRTCAFGLPCPLVALTLLACIAPTLLTLLGFDLSSQSAVTGTDVSAAEALAGSHLHTIFEWSAFCIAAFTALLAWIHYRSTGDSTAAIIGVALFCAGSMDAIHTLAATHLIDVTAGDTNLIPFTWALCRLFNGLVVIIGAIVVLSRGKNWKSRVDSPRFSRLYLPLALGLCVAVQLIAVSGTLPTTMYPDSLLKRPWDLTPLMIFVLAGTTVLPRMRRQTGSLFSAALLLAVVPDVVTQIHMAFGSSALFDANFNAAHFTKIIAYMVPFCGLALDYRNVQREQSERQFTLRRRAELLVDRQAHELRAAEQRVFGNGVGENQESLAPTTAAIADPAQAGSHCQQLLSRIGAAAAHLHRLAPPELDRFAQEQIDELLLSSSRLDKALQLHGARVRLAARPAMRSWVELHECANDAVTGLDGQLAQHSAVVGRDLLPGLQGDQQILRELYSVLIDRQLNLPGESTPLLHLSVHEQPGETILGVQRLDLTIGLDDGQSLAADMEDNDPALELCRDIVALHGGRLWLETNPGENRSCYFTLESANVGQDFSSTSPDQAPHHDPDATDDRETGDQSHAKPAAPGKTGSTLGTGSRPSSP